MKDKTTEQFDFVGFIKELVTKILLPDNNIGSPYDLFFSNYFNLLYTFEDSFQKSFGRRLIIEKVFQFKKEKILEVYLINNLKSDEEKNFINSFCADNKIGVKYCKNNTIVLHINKDSYGIKEDRQWK